MELREANANLTAQVLSFTATVKKLLEELTELKSRLIKNSSYSSGCGGDYLMRQNLVDSGIEADLKENLLASGVSNTDETGYYFDYERNWTNRHFT